MACASLTSITLDKCATNRGGILKVWMIDKDDATVSKTLDSSNNETGEVTITLAQGKSWSAFEFRKGSSSYNSELTVDEQNGISFMTSTLVLAFAKQEVAKRVAVQSVISNPNLLVVVKDANNEYTCMGVDEAASVTAGGANTGQAASDPNNYTITVTSIENKLPYFVALASQPDYAS